MILEITEQGAYLGRDHDSFVVKTKDEKRDFPAQKLDAIVISSNASISTAAVRLCLEYELQLVIAEPWGNALGRFWFSTSGKNSEIRRRQYLAKDNMIGLKLSRKIVTIKLKEQRKFLADLRKNRRNSTPQLDAALETLGKSIPQLDGARVPPPKGTLLGIEGNYARHYYSAIASVLPKKYCFETRSQHPSQDPFNALLNYSYGIGYREVETAIIISGLDPNAGLYHEDQYGKPTLSYDIIELFRPKIDRLILRLFAKKQVRDDWFEQHSHVCLLTKIARRAVIDAYYLRLHKTIQKEAWAFCRDIIRTLMQDED